MEGAWRCCGKVFAMAMGAVRMCNLGMPDMFVAVSRCRSCDAGLARSMLDVEYGMVSLS